MTLITAARELLLRAWGQDPPTVLDTRPLGEQVTPDMGVDQLRELALHHAQALGMALPVPEPEGDQYDDSPRLREDRTWTTLHEDKVLEQLAALTEKLGPLAAAQHLYGGPR